MVRVSGIVVVVLMAAVTSVWRIVVHALMASVTIQCDRLVRSVQYVILVMVKC